MADSSTELKAQIEEKFRLLQEQEAAEKERQRNAPRTGTSGIEMPSMGQEPAKGPAPAPRMSLSQRLNVLPDERRQNVEAHVKELGFIPRFALESALPTVGAMAGGALGGIPGAMVGGAAGEFMNQEMGFSPQSDFNLGVSGAAPAAAPLLGGALRNLRRGIGKGTMAGLPAARSALSQTVQKDAAKLFGQARTQIIAQRFGAITPELDEAITTLERGISKYTIPVKGKAGETSLKVGALRKWLLDVTSPKSKAFDPVLARELKPDLQVIDKLLATIEANTTKSGAGGPGGLVFRGLSAAAGAGVTAPIGMAPIGAMAGAQLPEIMSSMLLTPAGQRALLSISNAGKAPVNLNRMVGIMEVMAGPLREVPDGAQ